ncbi:MAG: hypothetical protein IPO23_14030 [Flavobacterium sp.]|nr:hypothetical protein [Flavobacterium sp.]
MTTEIEDTKQKLNLQIDLLNRLNITNQRIESAQSELAEINWKLGKTEMQFDMVKSIELDDF